MPRFLSSALLAASLCFSGAQPTGAQTDHLALARSHHVAGERLPALEHYRAYLAQPGGEPSERAAALNNLCLVLYDLGRANEALDPCAEALDIRRRLAGSEGRLARTLNNQGLVLQALGRWREARHSYRQALEINRRRDDASSVAVNLSNLGWLASQEGHYGEALDHHRQVEELAQRYAESAWAAEKLTVSRINRGLVLEKTGAFDEALELYLDLIEKGEQIGSRRYGSVLVNLGTVYRNLDDPHRAVDAYRRAASIFEAENDPAALSNAFLNLGQVLHQNLGDIESAEGAYRKALALARQSGDRGEEIQDLLLLGELHLDVGRLPQASELFTDCLALAEESGSAEGAWSALGGLGRTASRSGQDREALDHFESAIHVVERTRAGLRDLRLRSGFFASWRQIYGDAIEAHWRLYEEQRRPGDARDALALAQRAKQRELVDALGGRAVTTAMTDSHQLLGALHGHLEDQLGGATLIELFSSTDSLFVWRLDGAAELAAGFTWSRLGDRSDFEDLAKTTHASLSSGRPVGGLGALAAGLLPTGPPPRLLIAPDGALRYLPFEILPVSGHRWLDRAVISYLPSASALLRPPPEHPRALTFLGLADPQLGDDPSRTDPSLSSSTQSPEYDLVAWARRYSLGPLTASRREVEQAASILGGPSRLFVGPRATARALREAAVEGSRVVHLAAHTVIDERPTGGSALLLAAGDGHAGLVGPEDLSTLELNADLTVLAACRTAYAGEGRGSALGTLTGAVLAAGSRAVLATLWDVDDAVTGVFMEQFYYQLAAGLAPSQALAEAKRRLAADGRWSEPHLWAAYVLIGEAPAVVLPPRPRSSTGARLLVVLTAALAVGCLFALRRRRKAQGSAA